MGPSGARAMMGVGQQQRGACSSRPRPFTASRVPPPASHAWRSSAASVPATTGATGPATPCPITRLGPHGWPLHGSHRTAAPSYCGDRRTTSLRAVNLDDLLLDVPEIDGDIRSLQVEMGAIFDDAGLPTTFGKKRQALEALGSGLVLADQGHWGRLRVAGEDRLALLHNQSTADFKALAPGQGGETVFVTATARCLDLVTALVLPASVMLLVPPPSAAGAGGAAALLARLDKYIFPGDKVTVQDVSSRTAQIALLGPEAAVVLRELAPDALSAVLSGPHGSHVLVGFRGKPVFVQAGGGLGPSVPGFTLVADEAVAGDLYAAFAAKGAIPMGTDDWEAARILVGRPTRGSELTESYNPFEAGLYGAVSLNKGCYIGQETLAKLHLKDGVSKQLWGLQLSGPTEPGAEITSEMSRVGVVTSACQDAEGEWVGLGYIRSRLEATQIQLEGVRVAVAGMPATVTAIPFATRALSAASEAPVARAVGGSGSIADRVDEAKQQKAQALAAKQAETEAKLKVMQERLAAWQAQQQP